MCGSGSWLAHWEKLSGLRAFMCFAKGCFGRPSVGGHVQKDRRTDQSWYVVPLCSACNTKRGQDLDVWDYATLVYAAGGLNSGKGRDSGRTPPGAHRFSRRMGDVGYATAQNDVTAHA
jgi:hypothetical protein